MSSWSTALRFLLRRPGFTVTTLILLALGIGANSALFSIADTVLLKPLPYPRSQELVTVLEASPAKNRKEDLIAPARLEDWNRLNRTFTALAGRYTENVTDTSGAQPERLAGYRVTPGYFAVYETNPLLGRTFDAAEEKFGGPQAVVISYQLWSRRFNRAPGVIGKRLILGGEGYTIVGVMPKGFVSPAVDLWIPAALAPPLTQVRDARFLLGIGRLKPGVTPQQAQDDLARVQRVLGEEFPKTDKGWAALVTNRKDFLIGERGRSVWLLFGAVGLLLAIACANLAGLLLGQLYRREHEFAVRSSLGATRFQIIGTILREVGLLVVTGGVLGILLASWATELAAKIFASLPRMDELRLDWETLLFTLGVCLPTVVFVGLIPALQMSYSRLSGMLSRTSRTATGGRNSFQRILLVAQLAITMVLLSGAGLLLRSFYELTHVNTGFNAEHVLTFHVGAEWSEDRAVIGRLQKTILSEMQRLPQVEAAGLTNFLPTDNATLRYPVAVEGIAGEGENNADLAGSRTVTAGYLHALEIPLLTGQTCPEFQARSDQPSKALVNRSFVQQFGRGQNLVGKYFTRPDFPSTQAKTQIAGVIGDVREDNLRTPATPYVYNCAQGGGRPDPEYVVRTRGDVRRVTSALQTIVHNAAPNRAIFGVASLEDHVDQELAQSRLTAELLVALSFVALILAAVGLHSLINLMVTTKTREIGLRMAIGAERSQILMTILGDAGRLLSIGIAVGLIATFGLTRIIRSLLFGVEPADALTLVSVTALLFLVGLLAAFLPARRAASVSPVEALRLE